MAYEKMERSFPCPCKEGRIVAEWEEHDTWPSPNKYPTYRLECPACNARYSFSRILGYGTCLLLKADEETLGRYETNIRRLKDDIEQLARPKYEQNWVDHVTKQKTRTAMHREISRAGSYESKSGFMRLSRDPAQLDQVLRRAFRSSPVGCIEQLGIRDLGIETFVKELNDLKQECEEFLKILPKVRVPSL